MMKKIAAILIIIAAFSYNQKAEKAFFIDLNNAIAVEYEAMGPKIVKQFFPGDHPPESFFQFR